MSYYNHRRKQWASYRILSYRLAILLYTYSIMQDLTMTQCRSVSIIFSSITKGIMTLSG